MNWVQKWIWVDGERYPDRQQTHYSGLQQDRWGPFAVAEFARCYEPGQRVKRAELCVSGDTEFVLYVNGRAELTGPVSVGGDFLYNEEPRSRHYYTRLTLTPDADRLQLSARVKLSPVGINEYSRGHGGFMLSGRLLLEDGSIAFITTDESWQARINGAYTDPRSYDQALDEDGFAPARTVANRWHAEPAPLKPRMEQHILPLEGGEIGLEPGERRTVRLEYDRIYGCYAALEVQTQGELVAQLSLMETDSVLSRYSLRFTRDGEYRGFQLESVGCCQLTLENHSGARAVVRPFLIATCYPAPEGGVTVTDDPALDRVLDVCRHTLKYCRQMIHLDSPKHSEPLACTGDYYIEMLMTAMSFGDMELAEFDVERTAELLRVHDGRMFHTSYSLIWVLMLWDAYRLTGHRELLERCLPALYLLLRRFEGYLGGNGLLETPPDYMFVDWIYIDGISMHHPPKALGQTCLCAFYHGALLAAEKIYRTLALTADAARCARRADALREAVNEQLYDPDRGLYFDGLNTPTPEALIAQYMPRNVEKRYYMPHSNILCCCFGICGGERARAILSRVVEDEAWGVCQPYFMHYLLEAVFRAGLREQYTLRILQRWKQPVADCPKGLVEGFVAPEPTYSFDHSHAWGGTPLYALPRALLGLELLEPAWGRIALAPSLLGLKRAHVEVPTPRGMIVADMEEGREPSVRIPEGIKVVM